MSTNFKPDQSNYKNIGQFRAWCQKVLPLVYDDSVSYYELLGKVLQYLNDVISNINLVGEDMTKLYEAYELLELWVNTYFEDLDVQNEINKKLDEYATDGTLFNWFTPIATQLSQPMVVSSVSEMTNVQKTYVLSSNGHIYQYKNNAWVDTNLVYATNIQNYMTYGALPVTDLDELMNIGVYTKGSSMEKPLNTPSDDNGDAFVIAVLSNNSVNYRVQMYFPLLTYRMYIRKYNPSSGWLPWNKVMTEQDWKALGDYFKPYDDIPSNDLNELNKNGVYFNISTNKLLNTPVTKGETENACAVFVMCGSSSIRNYQIYFDYYTGRLYTRNSLGATDWTPWRRLLNETDIPTISSGKVSISKTSDSVYGINFGKYITKLIRSVNTNSNLDAWNLLGIYCDDVTVVNTGTDILGPIMELNEGDFVGGLHGDEKGTFIYITCDGKEWDYENTVVCKEIKIVLKSEIYRATSKIHIYNRNLVITISENKIVGEVLYKCLVDDSVLHSAPLGGLIGCPNEIITGIVMNNYAVKGLPTESVSNYSKNNVSGTINWTNGSITVNNLVGFNYEDYVGVLIVYEDKAKVYLYTIPPGETQIAKGEELFGKYEYLFS